MQSDQSLSYLLRFRIWLSDGGLKFLNAPAVALLTYALALMGGVVIGGTEYSILVLVGTVGLIMCLLIGLMPSIGVYLLIFTTFANVSSILESQFGVPDINRYLVILVLVGILARRVIIENKPILFRGTEMSVLGVGLAIMISLAFGVRHGDAEKFSVALDWVKDFIVFLIIVQFSTEEKGWKNTHHVLVGTVGFLTILNVYQAISGDITRDFYGFARIPVAEDIGGSASSRVTGPIGDPNFYAMFLLMVLPLAFYISLISQRRIVKITSSIISLTILTTILFTFSRGGFVALIVVSILVIIERKMNPFRIAYILIFLIITVYPYLPSGFSTHLNTLSGLGFTNLRQQTDSSFRGRSSELSVAILMFGDHPIVGVGKENYASQYLEYSSNVGVGWPP